MKCFRRASLDSSLDSVLKEAEACSVELQGKAAAHDNIDVPPANVTRRSRFDIDNDAALEKQNAGAPGSGV